MIFREANIPCMRYRQNFIGLFMVLVAFVGCSQAAAADINSDLRVAAAQGNAARIKELIGMGADVNAGGPAAPPVPQGSTALMFAAAQNFKDIVNILLSAGANPNQADTGGNTPLIYAVWKGHSAIVKILLEHGANVNARTTNGRTPLSVAESSENVAIVKLLKDAGANATPLAAPAFREDSNKIVEKVGFSAGFKDMSRVAVLWTVDTMSTLDHKKTVEFATLKERIPLRWENGPASYKVGFLSSVVGLVLFLSWVTGLSKNSQN